MAFPLTPADFRPSAGGLASNEAVGRYALTAGEANDTDLAATIARMIRRVERLTGDDFEAATETLKVSPLSGYWKLWLPKRASVITSVSTRDALGALTVQPAGAYRANLSLNAAGTDLAYPQVVDNLELLGPPAVGLTATLQGGYLWPVGPQVVEVTGTFGWTTAPADVVRAVAALVWNHYKPQRLDLGLTTRVTSSGETLEVDTEGATGLVEVDAIVRDYQRVPTAVG